MLKSCTRCLLRNRLLGWRSLVQASSNVKWPVCPTPADCICSTSGAICSAGHSNRLFASSFESQDHIGTTLWGPPASRSQDACVHATLYFTLFYTILHSGAGLLTGCKKGRTSCERLAVPKMRGRSAKHCKLQRCVAAAQHAILHACCVCVAYVLRMTKRTQRCK